MPPKTSFGTFRPAPDISLSVRRHRLALATWLCGTLVLSAGCTASDEQTNETTTSVVAETTLVVKTPPTTPAPARRVDGPPAAVGGNWIAIEAMSSQSIDVIWSDVANSPDLAEILDLETVAYRLHRAPWVEGADRDAIPLGPENLIYEGPELAYTDTDLGPSAEYTYFVVVEDGTGQTTAPRWRDGAAVDDTTPPETVTGFRAELDGSDIVLSWDESSDDYRFATYQIYRSIDGSPVEYHGTAWAANQTSFIDDDVPSNATIRYEIEALDFHTNASPRTGVDITN